MNRVLILADNQSSNALPLALRELGVEVTCTSSPKGALAALKEAEHHHPYDAVVAGLDVFTTGELAGVSQHRIALALPAVLPAIQLALGEQIDDCILLPLTADKLQLALARPRTQRRASLEADVIIGIEGGLLPAWQTLKKAAVYDTNVLLHGESGTGKELFARALHKQSSRSNGPFVAVNCAAVPGNLMEAHFFGHVAGAFTDAGSDRQGVFTKADGGTLFLDEVSDFPLELQGKILRALQLGEVQPLGSDVSQQVDVRLVSATSHDLQTMVDEGRFQPALFFQLAVIPIVLPPLRKRVGDLSSLIDHFVGRFSEKHQVTRELSTSAKELLLAAPWPGNVRQLQNAVERLVILSEGTVIEESLVEVPNDPNDTSSAGQHAPTLKGRPLKEAMRSVESRLIEEALQDCDGKRARCAEQLGISPRALLYKIKEHGL